jgi:hypothetical protein
MNINLKMCFGKEKVENKERDVLVFQGNAGSILAEIEEVEPLLTSDMVDNQELFDD